MIVVLTGGTGGAKFVDGLRRVINPEDLIAIVNTGDDFHWWGLHISPDIDSVMYVLSGRVSKERGWGVAGDTFFCLQTMTQLGGPSWFQVGDRDLAMHLLRTNLLAQGRTLSEATAEIASRMEVGPRVLPMCDSRVETRVNTPAGELSFQEYFVKRRYQDSVDGVRFEGAVQAKAAPGVTEAIISAEAVFLAPSNPVTSIGPILAVAEIRQALRDTSAPVAAISPIIGAAPVSGPAGILMAAQGFPISISGVAKAYEDFLDVLIVDLADEATAKKLEHSDLRIGCMNTIMRSADDRKQLARQALSFVGQNLSRKVSVAS
ncbi:MAG: 2-phospho-L-lactate transferase [Acidobacteriota bacterium]|nr:2-phospho-L-lactate transferase [Acidobacteriota bacterium]